MLFSSPSSNRSKGNWQKWKVETVRWKTQRHICDKNATRQNGELAKSSFTPIVVAAFFNKQIFRLGSKISNLLWQRPLSYNQTPEVLTSEQNCLARHQYTLLPQSTKRGFKSQNKCLATKKVTGSRIVARYRFFLPGWFEAEIWKNLYARSSVLDCGKDINQVSIPYINVSPLSFK